MNVDRNALTFFEALSSQTRLIMIELLGEKDMNIHELAQALNVSSTIVAKHVKVLESADIIRCKNVPGKRGVQKRCHLVHSGLLLNFMKRRSFSTVQNFEVPIGSYVDWDVKHPCGIELERSSGKSVLDFYDDDERAFADPRRLDAGIVWLTHGYLEYAVPNCATHKHQLEEIRIQLEICSEAPGYAMNWPSDIYFSINGLSLGYWTSPGDFGDRPGASAPEWQRGFNSKYGTLLQIVVNREGTFIGIERTADVTVSDIAAAGMKHFRFRVESPENAANPGGFNIFGKGFGDYGQHILFSTITVENES